MAAGVHFSVSLVVAVLAAWMVFGLWYPYPYRELSGGGELFLLIVAVDVVCGPLLTLLLYRPDKPRYQWRVDMALIAGLQLLVLGLACTNLRSRARWWWVSRVTG